MDPKDFISLAERLVCEGQKNANLRTATNRAYFAAHHVGSEILGKLTFTIPRNQHAHQEVVDMLQNSGEEDVEVVGVQLQDLYAARRRADYELKDGRPEKLNTVRGHVTQAKKMIASLEGCLTEPKRSRILASIRAWDQQR